MIKGRVVAMLATGLLMAGTASVARAADPDPDVWHVRITPYAWATGVYGDVTVPRNRRGGGLELPRHPRGDGHPWSDSPGVWK